MSAVWIPLDGSEFVVVPLRRSRSTSRRRTPALLEVQDPQKARTYHAITPMVDVPTIDGVQMHELRAFADAPSKWDERFVNHVSLPACFGAPILYGPVVFVHEDPAVSLDDDMFYDLWIRWLARPVHRNIDVLVPRGKGLGARVIGSGSSRVSPVTRTLSRLRRTSRDRFGSSVVAGTKDEDLAPDDDQDDDDQDDDPEHDDEDIVSSDDDRDDDQDDGDDLSDDDDGHEEPEEEEVPVARRTRRRVTTARRKTTRRRRPGSGTVTG